MKALKEALKGVALNEDNPKAKAEIKHIIAGEGFQFVLDALVEIAEGFSKYDNRAPHAADKLRTFKDQWLKEFPDDVWEL